ncbi:hypothetical protein OH828_14560 [Streptomyces anulatus]|uniref:hypothetical protein n=1 Tax=Streptomyces anulatus TaxID=1892 RepID=UPI00386FC6A9
MTKTAAAKTVEAGDWVTVGSMAWRVTEAATEGGTTYLTWGNGTTSEYGPNARVEVERAS